MHAATKLAQETQIQQTVGTKQREDELNSHQSTSYKSERREYILRERTSTKWSLQRVWGNRAYA